MTGDPRRHELRCNDCGKFLAFDELCFSKHHFQPLSELGPEESWWSCPACRDDWRADWTAAQPKEINP